MKLFSIFLIPLLIICITGLSLADITNNMVRSDSENVSSAILNDNTPLPVGILVMKSGFVSDIGTEYSRAFEMVQQDNPESLIHPVIMDGGSNASVASSSWQEMIQSNPDLPIVLTVASWTTNVVYPKASDSGIIQLALGSAVVNRSHSNDHLIRFTPGVEHESPILASFLAQYNRIAMIGGNNDYTNGYFSELDTLLPGKIILKSYYNPSEIESTLNITNIIQTDPDVIILLSVSEGGDVATLLRNKGITSPLVGTRVIERNSLAETEAAEGLIFTTPALNTSHPFFQRYFDEYGENATFYGAEGFDAMTTLYSTVSPCEGSSDCVYSWYKNRTYDGALGLVQFDETGGASYPIEFKIVHEGKFEDYSGEYPA